MRYIGKMIYSKNFQGKIKSIEIFCKLKITSSVDEV